MHDRPRSVATVLLFVSVLVPLAAAGLPAPLRAADRPVDSRAFGGETTITAIEVPVRVTRRGEPVRGLTADDFRLYESGERREIQSFEVLDLSVRKSAPEADLESIPESASARGRRPDRSSMPAPVDAGRRHFLFLFDLGFTHPGHLARAERSARRVLREDLHPSDRVGVAFYSPSRGAGLALQFTTDRRAVENVLDRLSAYLRGERLAAGDDGGAPSDPLGITASEVDVHLGEVGREEEAGRNDFAEALGTQPAPGGRGTGGRRGGMGDFLMNNLLSHSGSYMEQVYREREATRIAWMTEQLGSLVERLSGIGGPRYLVFLSSGYDVGLVDPMTNWSSTGGSGAGFWLLRELEDFVDTVRRAGWVIYGVQLGGAAVGGRHRGSLFHLAHETGGELIENRNDPADAIGEVIERTSLTYLLTFHVQDLPNDGSYRRLRVELVGGPRGTRVHHRPGYRTPRPWSALDPLERRLEAGAVLLAGSEVHGLESGVAASVLGVGAERARVPVVVEADGPSLLTGVSGEELEIEVYGYAFDRTGSVGDFFARHGVIDLSEVESRLREGGLRWVDELALEPGTWELRVLVQSANTGRRALRVLALDVPEPSAGRRLLTPFFLEGGDEGWLLINGSGADGGYPFTVAGRELAPAAVPSLSPGRSGRLLVLPGLGLDEAEESLSVRIRTTDGRSVNGGRVDWLVHAPQAGAVPGLLLGKLTGDGLEPGEYRLEIGLEGVEGPEATARFRIAGPADTDP